MGLFKKLGKVVSGVVGGHTHKSSDSARSSQEANNQMNAITQNMMREQQNSAMALKRHEESINTAHVLSQRRTESAQARAMRGRRGPSQFGEEGAAAITLNPRLG